MSSFKILLAPDKFKGTISAHEVCNALAQGLKESHPEAEIRSVPLADGGDGTLAVLHAHMTLERIDCETVDPLGRPMQASYLVDEQRAFIELASASGLVLLTSEERNPLHTSTFGTGLLVKDAIARGKRQIYLLLGGSATNDMGFGIASALGVAFSGPQLPAITGGDLGKLISIRLPAKPMWSGIEFVLLCDVANPLFGPNGAARVYGKQKGANLEEIEALDAGMRHASALLTSSVGRDSSMLPGTGAAGGIGGGLVPLLGAQMQSGFAAIAHLTELEKQIKWADVVFTGEGQLDSQSFQGKVVGNILELCAKYAKPCHVIVGRNTLGEEQELPSALQSIITLTEIASSMKQAMEEAPQLLEGIGRAQKLVI
ncbi:MAG: glycerate kinase [Saprospiraceae bacterium]